jgi:hypothetical protein
MAFPLVLREHCQLPQCAGMSLGWTVLEGRHDAAVEEADLIVK